MKTGENRLRVVEGNGMQRVEWSRKRRLQIIAAVVGLTVLLAGGAQWAQRGAGPAPQAAAQPKAAAQAEPAAIDYFPAQYVNQATEVEEHIQAF